MIYCPSCGTPNQMGTVYCGRCGTSVAPNPGVTLPLPLGPQRSTTGVWIAVVAAVALFVGGGLAFVLLRGGQEDSESDESRLDTAEDSPSEASTTSVDGAGDPGLGSVTMPVPPPSTTATTAPPTTSPPTTSPPATGPGDVMAQPSGLFCRDLKAMGYSYSAAVEYWRREGHTNQMDKDRNGIPCETVYPRSDVVAYWGDAGWGDSSFDYLDGVASGLLCRDLYSMGYTYGEAVAYWYREGAPDRMDEDLNGIPCETVYSSSTVYDYWGWGEGD